MALLQAEELGTPLTDALDQIAVEMRRATAQRARQQASRTSPRVALVVTIVMVPGALVLLVVSLLLSSGVDLGGSVVAEQEATGPIRTLILLRILTLYPVVLSWAAAADPVELALLTLLVPARRCSPCAGDDRPPRCAVTPPGPHSTSRRASSCSPTPARTRRSSPTP